MSYPIWVSMKNELQDYLQLIFLNITDQRFAVSEVFIKNSQAKSLQAEAFLY